MRPEILVVDDDAPFRRAVLRMLAAANLPAEGMRTAREAILAMEMHQARAVLLDVTLAEDDEYPDGCDAALVIARRWPNTRVAIMTGWSFRDLPPGCDGFALLMKPFSGAELVNRVRDLLGRPLWHAEDG